jgi:hypothetical protein
MILLGKMEIKLLLAKRLKYLLYYGVHRMDDDYWTELWPLSLLMYAVI